MRVRLDHPEETELREVLVPAQATARGLRPLSTTCIQTEHWILRNILTDMERGHIAHALVRESDGIAVWRSTHNFAE